MNISKRNRRSLSSSIPERVVIISLDAMGARDLDFMETLPNFRAFLEGAAVCKNVKSVYPSVTYPAHTSIMTGRLPKHHGIINNTLLQPERAAPDWYWQRRYVRGTTLYDEAVKAGWKTAALLWPVTAKSRIHYNIPEVLANRPWQNQTLASAMNSTLSYALKMNARYGSLRDGVRQPALDNFVQACALDTIQNVNPDLFLIHFTDLDTNRHIYGLDHEKAFDAMRRHDKRLGELLAALAGTKDMEKTTVVVLGDHCQMDTDRIVCLNYLLREKGYLETQGGRGIHSGEKIKAEAGRITSYRAIAKNCDGSCYIYLHPSEAGKEGLRREIKALLEEYAREGRYGIERILTAEEAGALGADDTCFLMLEAEKGVYFLDDWEMPEQTVREAGKGRMRATHGYLPDKPDYATFFAAKGFGIRKGASIPGMTLCDEGPTLARLMGLELGETDGHVVEGVLDG